MRTHLTGDAPRVHDGLGSVRQQRASVQLELAVKLGNRRFSRLVPQRAPARQVLQRQTPAEHGYPDAVALNDVAALRRASLRTLLEMTIAEGDVWVGDVVFTHDWLVARREYVKAHIVRRLPEAIEVRGRSPRDLSSWAGLPERDAAVLRYLLEKPRRLRRLLDATGPIYLHLTFDLEELIVRGPPMGPGDTLPEAAPVWSLRDGGHPRIGGFGSREFDWRTEFVDTRPQFPLATVNTHPPDRPVAVAARMVVEADPPAPPPSDDPGERAV